MSKHVWVPTLWLNTFQKMLDEDNELDYGDDWTLNFNYRQADKMTKEEKKRGWREYKWNTHGKFQCRSCNKTWPSARVKLLFRYRLRSRRGSVMMRPYRQACRDCCDDKFYLPGFEMENVQYTLLRLFRIIRENFYGEKRVKQKKSEPEAHTKPHEVKFCEACCGRFCSETQQV